MKLYIYYHVCQLGNWREVTLEQIELLETSGLYTAADAIFAGVLGDEYADLPPKAEVVYKSPCIKECELPTLEKLYKHAFTEDFKVLYIHTKGVSWEMQRKNRQNLEAWRRYMEYFCIGKWRECVAYLDDYDAVGVQWVEKQGLQNGHFSGNFWWSKSSYLKTLPAVRDTVLGPAQRGVQRMKAEMWIGSNPELKRKNMFHYPKPIDFFYHQLIDESLYKGVEIGK